MRKRRTEEQKNRRKRSEKQKNRGTGTNKSKWDENTSLEGDYRIEFEFKSVKNMLGYLLYLKISKANVWC